MTKVDDILKEYLEIDYLELSEVEEVVIKKSLKEYLILKYINIDMSDKGEN